MRLLAIALVVLVSPRPAQACTPDPPVSVPAFVLPADGSSPPRNTRVWIAPDALYGEEATPSNVEIRADGVVVPATGEYLSLEGPSVVVMTPDEPFVAGSEIEVWLDGSVRSRFQVGQDEDHEPPPVPSVQVEYVDGEHAGACSCGDYSSVVLVASAEVDLLVALSAAETSTGLPSHAVGVGVGGEVTATGLPPGEHALRAIAIDLAGNTSEAGAELTVTIPDGETSGCSVDRGGSWLAPLLVATAISIHRARRRPGFRRG